MESFRYQGRPMYMTPTAETYAYQTLYGTVRGNPNGRLRPTLNAEIPSSGGKNKKSFNFLPWKKGKSKGDDCLPNGTLSKHHKMKFGSVSTLTPSGMDREWTATLSHAPSYVSSDMKHSSVRSMGGKTRSSLAYPWEQYGTDVERMNFKNKQLSNVSNRENTANPFPVSEPPSSCKCQKKKTGAFGTLNLGSLKSSKCNCGFSSVRSIRNFAPPPPPSRRRSILPDKVDLYAVHEDQVPLDTSYINKKNENIYDTLSRHRKYKAPTPPTSQYLQPPTAAQTKFVKSLDKCKKDPYGSVSSRKSILECNVTAYDLVKSYLKNDAPNEMDSDIDDDLSDNVLEDQKDRNNASLSQRDRDSLSSVERLNKVISDNSPSPISSETESGIYSQSSSIRIGGHGMKLFPSTDGNSSPQNLSLYSDGSKTNSVDSRTSSWSNSSLSDDGIYSLPEPDYDDDKDLSTSDPVLRLNERIYSTPSPLSSTNLRKIATGRFSSNSDLSSRPIREECESPRYPTIRKATSMMSLASGPGSECGTYRRMVKTPSIPEVPNSTLPVNVPPPPPPPPPPPNFSLKKTISDKQETTKKVSPEATPPKALQGNNLSSSIASELTERLKSNKPLLKKNEIKKKEPMQVNSHNPYAEVKSILKKTGAGLTSVNSGEDSSAIPVLDDDFKKKKRVQFKSLSNESLVVDKLQHQALSSSDEEWEEARENFSNESVSHKLEESRKKNDDSFQTVEEFLKAKSESINKASPKKSKDDKIDDRVTSKPMPRPTQPPPPPPVFKKGGVLPPPRPLRSTPKSFSTCDLRSPAKESPRLLKISVRNQIATPNQNLSPAKYAKGFTVTDSSMADKKENGTAFPKNGVSSPAASPEDTTSSRGKSTTPGDHEPASLTSNPTSSGDKETNFEPLSSLHSKFQPENHHRIHSGLSKADSSLSHPHEPDVDYGHCGKDEEPASTPIAVHTNLKSRIIDSMDLYGDVDNNPINIEPSPDYPMQNNEESRKQMRTTEDGKMKCIINNTSKHDSPTYENKSDFESEPISIALVKERNTMDTTDSSHYDDTASVVESEGPPYSVLSYVPERSPSPPPLPTSLPPLPPKRHPSTKLTTTDSNQVKISNGYQDVNNLYDSLPPSSHKFQQAEDAGQSNGTIVVTISNPEEHLYSSLGSEDIYEEVADPDFDSLPSMDDPVSPHPFGRHRRSFFEGASKAEILKFLERAKDRVEDQFVDALEEEDVGELHNSKNVRNNPIRVSNISSSSDSSTISSNSSKGSGDDISADKPCEVERSDSGLGSETCGRKVRRSPKWPAPEEPVCADCDQRLGIVTIGSCCPLVCEKCDKKRTERKEIVTEIVETEFKYGKDLCIIKEEFKTPMEVAGLLMREQLSGIFLNLDELILVNIHFAEKLKDAVDIATEQGDEDYTTVNIGKLFLETTTMLKTFEYYCIRQGSASVHLAQLEKEKELLRIFLKVSQMENSLLRRMNLAAFLMVPVQRVTKYPLLLNRLHKVTPYHHQDRESLREAQLKIELHLEHINQQQTKGSTGTKLWRRISNISAPHRRTTVVSDIGSIQLRKMALEVLEWSREEIRFVLAGRLGVGGAGCEGGRSTRRGRAPLKFSPTHALLATRGRPNALYRPDLAGDQSPLFPRDSGIEDAALLLVREKGGRHSLARDPLHLGTCVICSELEDEDVIEIQEHSTRESLFLKAECRSDTQEWLKQLRYHAKDLGVWRRRRNALANIMINGMLRQQ